MQSPRNDRCAACGRRHKRSNPANARYWLLLHEIAERVKPGGMSYSPDQWHLYFKSRYLGADDVELPNKKVLTVPKSSAALDVAEFNDYMTQVEVWAGDKEVWLEDRE